MSGPRRSLVHRQRFNYLIDRHQFLRCAAVTSEADYYCFSQSSRSFKSCCMAHSGLGSLTGRQEGRKWQLDHAGTARIGSCFGEEADCMSVNSNDDDLAYPDPKHYCVDASDC